MLLLDLHQFAVRAKKSTYVVGGGKAKSCRLGSHDLAFADGAWSYLDSFFGGTDFLGQEAIWFLARPVWSMVYHGRILRSDLIDADRAAQTIRAALSLDKSEGRLIDNLDWAGPHGHFSIHSTGDIARFSGRETISVGGSIAYELDYQGGLVKP